MLCLYHVYFIMRINLVMLHIISAKLESENANEKWRRCHELVIRSNVSSNFIFYEHRFCYVASYFLLLCTLIILYCALFLLGCILFHLLWTLILLCYTLFFFMLHLIFLLCILFMLLCALFLLCHMQFLSLPLVHNRSSYMQHNKNNMHNKEYICNIIKFLKNISRFLTVRQ
jgi:hypothetical protein